MFFFPQKWYTSKLRQENQRIMYIQLIHIEKLHQDTGEKEKDFNQNLNSIFMPVVCQEAHQEWGTNLSKFIYLG